MELFQNFRVHALEHIANLNVCSCLCMSKRITYTLDTQIQEESDFHKIWFSPKLSPSTASLFILTFFLLSGGLLGNKDPQSAMVHYVITSTYTKKENNKISERSSWFLLLFTFLSPGFITVYFNHSIQMTLVAAVKGEFINPLKFVTLLYHVLQLHYFTQSSLQPMAYGCLFFLI
jgi:hypothetical protein